MHTSSLIFCFAALSLFTAQAVPDISVQRWKYEDLESTGGVLPEYPEPNLYIWPHYVTPTIRCAPSQVRPVIFKVRNMGGEPLLGLTASLSGLGSNSFVISHPLPAQLAGGESTTLVVSFAPNAKALSSALLTIQSNDPDEASFTVPLYGDSRQDGAILTLKEVGKAEIKPKELSLVWPAYSRPYHTTVASSATLVATNVGDRELKNLQVISTEPSPFLPVAILSATTLAPGESMTVRVSNESSIYQDVELQGVSDTGPVGFRFSVSPGLNTISPWPIGGYPPGVITLPLQGVSQTNLGIETLNKGYLLTQQSVQNHTSSSATLVFNGLPPYHWAAPVAYAFHWRLGDSDADAAADSIITATRVQGFAANGDFNLTFPVSISGTPTYLNAEGSPAAAKMESRLGAHFDGTGKITSNIILSLGDNFAVESWVRPQTDTGTQAIMYTGTAGVNGFGIYQVGNRLRGRLGGVVDVGEATFTPGEWVHVALVRKLGVATFYVNGLAAGASVTDMPIGATTGGMTLGGTPAGTDLFTGDLDEVRWANIGYGFDPDDHLLHAQSGPKLRISLDTQYNPPISGPVEFRSLYANSSFERALYVTNDAFAPAIALKAVIQGDHPEDFELRDPLLPMELRAYAIATVRVRFSPKALGTRKAILQITTGRPGEAPIDIPLVGEGVLPPELYIQNSSGDDLPDGTGALSFGTAPDQQTIKITNNGGGPLLDLSAGVEGQSVFAFEISELPPSLAPGASALVTIKHTGTDANHHSAILRIRSNDPDESYYGINLSGLGAPRLEAKIKNEVPLEPGRDVLGFTEGLRRTVVIQNTGDSELKQLALNLTGTHAGDYSIVSPVPTSLPPGGSANLEIAFSAKGLGIRAAILAITSSDPNLPVFALALAGRKDFGEVVFQVQGRPGNLISGQYLLLPAAAVSKSSSVIVEATHSGYSMPLQLASVVGGNETFEVEVLERAPVGRVGKTRLRVSFKPLTGGFASAVLRLNFGSSESGFEATFKLTGYGVTPPVHPFGPEVAMLKLGGSRPFLGVPIILNYLSPILIWPWPPYLAPPPDVYQWRKNGQPIPGATSNFIEITANSLKSAGVYQFSITNIAGTVTFDSILLGVVDPVLEGPDMVGVGKIAELKVRAAGPNLNYQWFANGAPIANATQPKLTISAQETSEVVYECLVGQPGNGEQVFASRTVRFVEPPVILGPRLKTVITHGWIEEPIVTSGIATHFSAIGLPPGVRLNPNTGVISGYPSVSGEHVIKLRASNPAGFSETYLFTLWVKNVSPEMTGQFSGLMDRDPELNDNMGGALQLSITNTLAYTGRLRLGSLSWPLAGKLSVANQHYLQTTDMWLGRGDDPRYYSLTVAASSDSAMASLRRSADGKQVEVTAHKHRPGQAGRFNVRIITNDLQRDITTPIPEGRGFASIVVANQGNATATGRTADGAAFTFTSSLTSQGIPGYALMYGQDASFTCLASAQGDLWVGWASWNKKPRLTDATYPEGWKPIYGSLEGGRYVAPRSGQRLLGAPATTPNAILVFSKGGLPENTEQKMLLSLSHAAARPAPSQGSPKSFALSIQAETGHFNGSCLLGSPAEPASFHGLIVPIWEQSEGVGYFLRGRGQKLSGDLSMFPKEASSTASSR